MAVLGFERYDLYGVSYGTRIGLEMLRQRPEVLRAAVLDSVYPPQVHPELTQPWLLARVLGWIPRICELSDACDIAPERIGQDLQRSFERLRRQPLAIEVIDPVNRERLSVLYNADDLLWLLFESLYVWDFITDVPAMLEALAEGRTGPALRQMIQYSVSSLLDPEISDAVAAAVDCRDAAPLRAADYARERARYPEVAEFTEYDFQSGFCRFWRSGDLGADFRRPVRAEVPTLLLAGEFDPVTPPEWAELAASTLSHASVVEFPGIGHGVLDSDACAVDLVRSFLESPEAPPRVACLDEFVDRVSDLRREARGAE
jgi:pimeloyl-ACP methyl ester carboxylesterase